MSTPGNAELKAQLVQHAGGYLRNPIRIPGVTCAVCATPVDGFERCYPCHTHHAEHGSALADATAFITYGISGKQSGRVMYGYKAATPVEHHSTVVTVLGYLALSEHSDCVAKLVGQPVSHWAAVPSLGGRTGVHPLRAALGGYAVGAEVEVVPGVTANPRQARADHYRIEDAIPPGAHVQIIEDTWASGGHAQSLALALRAAGAGRVSTLVVARWLDPSFGSNAEFERAQLTNDFDPDRCPWTGGACP